MKPFPLFQLLDARTPWLTAPPPSPKPAAQCLPVPPPALSASYEDLAKKPRVISHLKVRNFVPSAKSLCRVRGHIRGVCGLGCKHLWGDHQPARHGRQVASQVRHPPFRSVQFPVTALPICRLRGRRAVCMSHQHAPGPCCVPFSSQSALSESHIRGEFDKGTI